MAMTKLTERNKLHTNHGKWSIAGVPHKGWGCISKEDLGNLPRNAKCASLSKFATFIT